MPNILDTEIKFLKGVGPKRAELLASELEVHTFFDLIYYFPFRYIDRSRFYSIAELNSASTYVQIRGKIRSFKVEGSKYAKRLKAVFADHTGEIELVWFKGVDWALKNYNAGAEYVIFGKPTIFNRRLSIAHPEIESIGMYMENNNMPFMPQYHTTEKLKNSYLNSKAIQVLTKTIFSLENFAIAETLPESLIKKHKLMPLEWALKTLHFPSNLKDIQQAEYRIKFEELFYIQLNILKLKTGRNKQFKGFVFKHVGDNFNKFYKEKLPFELTGAQKRVIKEIRNNTATGNQMNRLLQGDVGSGKTLVALMSMLLTIDNGFQACLMAPTEILANQHFSTISAMLEGLDINVELLTGSTRKKKREVLFSELASGRLNILIGTHALIEDPVQFANLGLVVIDEQHRFGVAQRAKLWQKNEKLPHVLVMTATPIPRTLAMTLYGDLDVSVIDELPPGRKPILTYHYFDAKRLSLIGFLRKQVDEGRQVYIVYPLIKESEKLDLKDLQMGFDGMAQMFPPPDYNVICVHGKMKSHDKEIAMQVFKAGKAHILMATTVIEVGVDVPNATIMIIENAERFGLSQLHQLRGRVGRGGEQSYCILMTSHKLTSDAKKRLETMVATNDGFEIAEVDLKLRGPGDIEGTQQSGIPFNLLKANLARDGRLLQHVRDIAEDILEKDPLLTASENKILNKNILKQKTSSTNWSVIS
jgi:ATP-dependent DNA helicase RecG